MGELQIIGLYSVVQGLVSSTKITQVLQNTEQRLIRNVNHPEKRSLDGCRPCCSWGWYLWHLSAFICRHPFRIVPAAPAGPDRLCHNRAEAELAPRSAPALPCLPGGTRPAETAAGIIENGTERAKADPGTAAGHGLSPVLWGLVPIEAPRLW